MTRSSSAMLQRSVALAWAVPILTELAGFARSILLARLIGADELGKAMLLALVLRLVEMASDVGVERLLAQAPDGDEPQLQAQLHGVAVLRGVVMALVLLGLAPAMAYCFGDGPQTGSYLLLALVPLGRAFLHLDYRRAERQRNYRLLASVEISASLAMLLGAGAAAFQWGDHRAILGAVLAQVAVQVGMSHFLAMRAYRVELSLQGQLRVWRFGAPLIANACLMFLILQADRIIVAGAYGWADVAIYGVVVQLAMLPAQIVGRAGNSLMAPRFRVAIAAGLLGRVARSAMAVHFGLAVVFAGGFIVLANPVILWAYGAEFSTEFALIAAAGCAGSVRILRVPISQLAVSLARTGDPGRANIWRALALVPATIFAVLGAPLATLAICAALGEMAAFVRGRMLLHRAGVLSRGFGLW
jgi:O-antigen/teichoic acid export membrane protein